MIKLIEITGKQKLCEAFGVTDEQATVIKGDIIRAYEDSDTWTECIEQTLSDDDTPLVEAFKLLTIGELLGTIKLFGEDVT